MVIQVPTDAGDAMLSNWAGGSVDDIDHGEELLKSWSEQPSSQPAVQPRKDKYFKEAGPVALGETLLNTATGGIASLGGGLTYLGTLAATGNLDAAKAVQEDTQKAFTYEPRTAGGQELTALRDKAIGVVSNAWSKFADRVGEGYSPEELEKIKALDPMGVANGRYGPHPLLGAATKVLPAAVMADRGISKMLEPRPEGVHTEPPKQEAPQGPKPPNEPTVEGVPVSEHPAIKTAEANAARAKEPFNPKALERHLQANSLPVPVKLTAGQATQDVSLLSEEMNMRGKQPALAQRFNEQNGQLIQNINAIRDQAAPDVTAVDHVQNGQTLIDLYKAKDEALNSTIRAKYQALEQANGGNFPVNGQAFVQAADAALKAKMKGRYVPAAVAGDLEDIRNGQPMTFETFENLRTNLAAEIRKAQRSGDGNAAMAASIVRDKLESLPMTGEASNIKPLADAARVAAKERFDMLRADPAYDAAINDSVAADDFIQKFVVNGKKANVDIMRQHLADEPLAAQTMSAGAINYLKNKAGILGEENGNFSQAGYNKALASILPKRESLFDQVTAEQLQNLGDVARYTQAQPRGSYVNTSNTLTAAASDMAANTAEGMANVAAKGIPVGTVTRKLFASRAAAKQAQRSLEEGAGIGGNVPLSELMKKK